VGAICVAVMAVGVTRITSAAPVARGGWIVSADEALRRVAAGARLLDARKAEAFAAGHVTGAVHVRWDSFSAGAASQRGRLSVDDARLRAQLEALGVDAGGPVVVVGDPVAGWGEEGRVAWMLRTLGHAEAAWVDGGHAALVAAGAQETQAVVEAQRGQLPVRRTSRWTADTAGTASLRAADDVVLLDARERREFDGQTPYGETRGGHVPGAVHLHYRDLLDGRGFLRSREEVESLLAAVGVAADRRVVVYCTGGVRSAWLVSVLVELGWPRVHNYAASMWEWAARPAGEFPLQR